MTLLRRTDDRRLLLGSLVLTVVAVVGLYVVKWNPYFYKAIDAASSHSLGEPIAGEDAPAPSVGAALGYAAAYFLAVWKAMVLGLLIGSGVQALLPREWLAKALAKAGLGSSTVAAALAVPSMMCTCCATPVAVGLKRCKVSTGAATAYLLGNPMLAPASYERAFKWFDQPRKGRGAAPLIIKANRISNVHRRVPLDLFIVPVIE